jgi:ATP-dependent protease ClpP protease subunit
VEKEILLYTSISAWSVADFINSLEQAKNSDITIRMNTPGGSVYDGYGAIAKYNEFPNNKRIKVDGRADSFGAYMLCFTDSDNTECLDVSTFTFHRAALPAWYEADANYFTEDVKAQLNEINANLRMAIESKCTPQKWKSVTGVSMDDMFSLNSRIDVKVTAQQAKKLGIVKNIVSITPQKLNEIKAYSLDLAAELVPQTKAEETQLIIKSTKMTTADVKANAEVYAELKAEILAAEKDRIGAFAAFKDIDAKAVLEEIVAGNQFTQTFAATMTVKAMSAQGLANLAAAATPAVVTPDATTEKTKEELEVEAFEKNLVSSLKTQFGIA